MRLTLILNGGRRIVYTEGNGIHSFPAGTGKGGYAGKHSSERRAYIRNVVQPAMESQ